MVTTQAATGELVTPEKYDQFPEFAAIGLRVGDEIPLGFVYGEEDAPAPEASKDAAPAEEEPAKPEPIRQKHFRGKIVVSDGFRQVEDRKYHHVKLDDGSEFDLSDEEYATKVTLE